MNVCVCVFSETHRSYYINYIFSIIFLLVPKCSISHPHHHTHANLFITYCLQNKYPKEIEILCQVTCKYKRYLWKHYLNCFLKETFQNILLVSLVLYGISRGYTVFILPEGQVTWPFLKKHSKWKILSAWMSSLVRH